MRTAEAAPKARTNRATGDLSIPILTLILSAFGVLMVYSASSYTAKTQYGDEFYFMKKQLLGLILGAGAMVFTGFFDYRKLKKIRYIALIVPMILLALVFVPGVGKSNYGATRWIGFGSFTIQPSEIAKYGFVIFAAAYMSEHMDAMRTFKGMLPVLAAGGAICVLIILEPNMSVTMCVGLLMLAMIFLGGMKFRYFLIILVPALVAVPVLILMEPYRLLRLSAFLDPWASPKDEGYQLIQSLYALGNGGWFERDFSVPVKSTAFCRLRRATLSCPSSARNSGSSAFAFSSSCAGCSFIRASGRLRNRTTFFPFFSLRASRSSTVSRR